MISNLINASADVKDPLIMFSGGSFVSYVKLLCEMS